MLSSLLLASMLAPAAATSETPVKPGLEWTLAQSRAKQIRKVDYDLSFDIPAKQSDPVHVRAEVSFDLASVKAPVILDDKTASAQDIESVEVNGHRADYELHDQHLILRKSLRTRRNHVVVLSRRNPPSLNRQADYLYTLFVPDRASQAFPCFDQPDMKAHFKLTLTVPADWVAVGNSRVAHKSAKGDRKTFAFDRTPPISTYLFAFAAGKFRTMSEKRDGRTFTAYYRESDDEKVRRNMPKIFELHSKSIHSLETYTGLPYPFPKFDFVLLPAFQFGGMEHPGAVLYREPSLLLDASATRQQLLARANVIAHEVSHMWFGDLVTMRWFNDVWMKEVMANFLAAKVTQPLFSDLPHDLKFYLEHQPGAADIDRSEGTNAIRQELANLQDAGSLYGGIIYLKAPIVMNQLEHLIGEDNFRAGLREYLRKYRFANADWTDLIRVFSKVGKRDLADWSHVWIEEAGRPEIWDGPEKELLIVSQDDPAQKKRVWPQKFAVASRPGLSPSKDVDLSGPSASLPGMSKPLLNADGQGYGFFRLDIDGRRDMLAELPQIATPLGRAVAWSAVWDEFLAEIFPADAMMDLAYRGLLVEKDDLVLEVVLKRAQNLYWEFFNQDGREKIGPAWEKELWRQLSLPGESPRKPALWNTLVAIVQTTPTLDRLQKILNREESIPGLPLAEPDEMKLAQELALRRPDHATEILDREANRLTNPDRREEFAFERWALAKDAKSREQFFVTLKDPARRTHEVWVVRALELLGHPLHGDTKFMIVPGLELMPEIQRSGNIFFPKDWMTAILKNRRSLEEVALVRQYLKEHPDEPADLRAKILQSADMMFRAARAR